MSGDFKLEQPKRRRPVRGEKVTVFGDRGTVRTVHRDTDRLCCTVTFENGMEIEVRDCNIKLSEETFG